LVDQRLHETGKVGKVRARAEALVGALDAGFLKQSGFLLSSGGTPLTLIGFGLLGERDPQHRLFFNLIHRRKRCGTFP
jgi:hypothetical protein